MKENGSSVKSLNKAVDILDFLSMKSKGMKLTEISSFLGYPKSTVYAILSTLRERSLINQLDDGTYTLGIKLFEYGSAVSRGFDINKVSRPYLEELSSIINSNTVISMFDGNGIVSFDYAASPSGIQIIPEIGVRLPLHATSQGKLMLSSLSRSRVERFIEKKDMISFTPHTITETERLYKELEKIKKDGYAVEDGEYKIGLRSVSAPVFDSTGEMKYTLTAIGFFRRVSSDEFQSAVKATVNQSIKLSQALGYRTK